MCKRLNEHFCDKHCRVCDSTQAICRAKQFNLRVCLCVNVQTNTAVTNTAAFVNYKTYHHPQVCRQSYGLCLFTCYP